MSIFEAASRAKVRFQTDRGNLSVEDLWDLPLTSTKSNANLDQIARDLHNKIQRETVSFINPNPTQDPLTPVSGAKAIDTLKFDIVKHVIGVRVAESQAALAEGARRQQKAKILELLARKQDAALESKSEDELKALLESL